MNNILFATNNFYIPQSAGGSESSTHDLCQSLIKYSFHCGVLCDLKPTGIVYFKNRLKGKLTKSKYPCESSLGYPVYRGWNAVNGVKEVIKTFKPDIAIIQAGKPLLLANEFIQNNIKTVVYLRDVEFHTHGGLYTENSMLHFIANSNFTATSFHNKFGLHAKIIPPLVHSDSYIENCLHWLWTMQLYYSFFKKRKHVITVRYEDLVLNPKNTLNTICQFIGLNFESSMLKKMKLTII